MPTLWENFRVIGCFAAPWRPQSFGIAFCWQAIESPRTFRLLNVLSYQVQKESSEEEIRYFWIEGVTTSVLEGETDPIRNEMLTGSCFEPPRVRERFHVTEPSKTIVQVSWKFMSSSVVAVMIVLFVYALFHVLCSVTHTLFSYVWVSRWFAWNTATSPSECGPSFRTPSRDRSRPVGSW